MARSADEAVGDLHSHSYFSFLDGASTVDAMVERAVELGLEALALTDHQGLYGAVRFSAAAERQGCDPSWASRSSCWIAPFLIRITWWCPHVGRVGGSADRRQARARPAGDPRHPHRWRARAHPVRPAAPTRSPNPPSRGPAGSPRPGTRPAPGAAMSRHDRLGEPVPDGQRGASGRHEGRAQVHPRVAGASRRGSGAAYRLPSRRGRAAAPGG